MHTCMHKYIVAIQCTPILSIQYIFNSIYPKAWSPARISQWHSPCWRRTLGWNGRRAKLQRSSPRCSNGTQLPPQSGGSWSGTWMGWCPNVRSFLSHSKLTLSLARFLYSRVLPSNMATNMPILILAEVPKVKLKLLKPTRLQCHLGATILKYNFVIGFVGCKLFGMGTAHQRSIGWKNQHSIGVRKKMLPTGEHLGILECACHPQACNHKFFKDRFLDIRFICYICIGDVQHLLHFPLPWWINPWSLGLASKQAASHFSVQDCLGNNGWRFTIHTGWYNTSPQDDELHYMVPIFVSTTIYYILLNILFIY